MEKDVNVTKSFFKKLTALLMAVLMLVSACPVSAFAVDASTPVSLNGSTFMQGDTVKAEFYSSGNGSEWYGLYYADATPASGNSIAWAYPSKLKSGSDIACYEMWKALDNDADADVNNGDAFYYQSSDGKWHLSPGKYKFVYFSNGSYTSFTESKVAYFDVTDGSGSIPDVDYTPSLSVNKTTFCVGEDILVTASGSGEAWIGIHLKGDTPGDGNSYYWYNVSGSSGNGVSSTSGTEYAIQDKVAGGGSDGNFDAGAGLPVGEYVIRYFADGGYSSISFTKEIKVVSHSNISETSVTKASFKNEGAVNGSCGVCGAATVKEIIGKATMELASDNFEYTGSPVEAPVIVRDAKGNVISSDNYTVQYKQNTEISTDTVYAVATVTFKSTCERYQGSYSLKYYIVEPHTHNFTKDIVTKATFDKDGKIEKGCTECAAVNSASAVVIPKVSYAVVEKTGYHYTGSAITPAVTVKDSSGKTFRKGTDYTVTYSDNINKGTATAAVTLLGAYYEGTKAISFSIGSMELEKSVYEEGDKIKLTLTASGSADEWIGIYNKSATPSASAPSIVWGNTSAMTSGMDIADYDSWSNLSSGGVNNADLFGFKTDDGVWHLSKGEYKVVVFADSGYTVSQSIDFTVKEKELRKDVTVKTDKSAYSEYDTIKVTVVNGKVTDAVAIYKSGSDVPVKKVTLTSGSTVSISPKLFSSGTYKAVVLQDSMEAYKIAESAEFTVTRTSVHGKYIVLNKSAYCTGEDIVVTAEGKNKDWLGIYGTADVIGDPNITAPAAYYWYYVDGKRDDSSTTYKSGDTVVLNSYTNLGERSFFTHGDLPVGLYKVVLFENDTFTELDKIEISVKEHKYTLAETKAATCTANGYEKYVCTGCGKSKQNVLYASHKDDNSNQVCDICSAAIKAVLSGECGANGNNVTYTLYDDGTLMIKGSGEMKEYWYASPFSSENKVKKVVISSGVTSVGSWAFANCTAIESVTIPSSVKKIGNWAFSGCSGLKKVNISSGLTYIGMRAFNNCTALEEISLPSSLTTIDDNAFYSCLSLKSIVIPDNTTYIGAYAFYDCSSLESVTIGKKVSEIGIYAFLRCSALSDITVKDGNTSFVSEDGVLFNNAKTTLIQYPAGSSKTTYTVPSTVTTISWSAFYGSSALVRVTIGSGVKTIETEAFSACTGIESITIPANVTSVGYRAFYGCSALMSISFLNTQCTVSDGADTIYSGATIYGKSGSTAEAYANKYERTFKTTCSHSNTTAHGKVTATCSAPGYTAGTYCNDCKTWISGRTEIPATSHTEATVKGYAATCTTAGLTDGKKCSVCQTVLSAQSIIPATGHKEETIKGYAATCTVPGLTDGKKCSVCQTVLSAQSTISALGHKEETLKGYAPTCTDAGLTDGKKCTVCLTVTVPQTKIEAKGHSYVKTVTAPTCIAQGYTVYNCACGNSYVSDYVPENGHTVTAYSAKDPTCKAIGWYAYEECSVCDYSTYTERPVVDHKDENGDFKCDYDCGYEFTKPSEETTTKPSEETTTKPSEETTTEPSEETTTKPSEETTTKPSEETTTEPSEETTTEPSEETTTKPSEETTTEPSEETTTEPSDETTTEPSEETTTKPSEETTTEPSEETTTKPSEETTTEPSEETTTKPSEETTTEPSEETTTEPSTGDTHTHEIVVIPAISPTCTASGYTEGKKCSVCQTVIVPQKVIEAKGHSYTATVTAATCITQGYTIYTCVCSDSYISEIVPANGHSKILYAEKNPTCREKGWFAYEECSVCDYSTYTERPVTSHADTDGDYKCDFGCSFEFEKPVTPEEPTTVKPSEEPTTKPSEEPTTKPSEEPTIKPSEEPTTKPSEEPTTKPSEEPTTKPSEEPTTKPSEEPTTKPSEEPTIKPSEEPTTKLSEEPTTKPSEEPTTKPSTPQTHTHTVVVIPAVSATYTKTGLTEGKKCSVCGKTLVSQKKVARKKLSKVSSLSKKAVTLAKGSKSTLTLSWKKVTGAEKYEIYRYVNKKWKKIKTTSKTSYKVTKLTANKTYKFKVRAVAGTNIGSFSKVLTAKTVPLKPTLTVKAGKKQLTASWKTVASITGYEVQYSTSKKFTKKTTKTSKITKAKTTKKTIKSLKKGKKYYVRVRAYKTVNGKKVYSSWSSVKSVKVK